MADYTATVLDKWLEEVWSHRANTIYASNTGLTNLLDRSWESELRGDTVNIPHFTESSTASNRGAGTGTFGTGAAVTFTAVTESQTQLVVNRLYYLALQVPEELVPQALPPFFQLRLADQAKGIAVQIDTDIAADGTNGFDAFTNVVGTDNVDVTEDDILTCETNIDNANHDGEGRVIVCSPATKQSLRKIESLRNSLYADTSGTIAKAKGPGYIGTAFSFDVHQFNLLEAGSSGKKNAAFHKTAIAYAEQLKMTVKHSYDMTAGFFDQVATLKTCGFKMVKNNAGNELDGK